MKRTIGEILKEHRINAKISVKQISELLVSEGFKASEKTIYSWESGNSQPTPDALLTMCRAYGITDILSTFDNIETKYDKPSKNEWEFIKKYRLLDNHGIKTVDYILNSEIKRVEAYSELMAQKNEKIVSMLPHLEVNAAHERTDIEITDEMRKHDDDIMDDENF